MSKADVAIVEEPLQFTSQLSSSSGKQPQAANPEGAIVGDEQNPEFKLPKMSSLVVVLVTNVLMQVISRLSSGSVDLLLSFRGKKTPGLFFHHRSVVERVRGTVGRRRDLLWTRHRYPDIYLSPGPRPTLEVRQRYQIAPAPLSPTSLIEVAGGYKIPIHLCCSMSIVGNLCYALAHKANFLYLILIGRMITGIAFTFFMYAKKYCSDPRIVGIRRRTTLAAYLVVGQGTGLSLGPFLGGALYRIGFGPNCDRLVFNGFTSPGWLMAAVWLLFWGAVTLFFEDVQATPATRSSHSSGIELQSRQPQPQESPTDLPSP